MQSVVNTANNHILKFQSVESFILVHPGHSFEN